MAVSAFFISSRPSSASLGKMLMPMLQVVLSMCPPTFSGMASARMTLRATWAASSAWLRPSRVTTNSSPPRRDKVSPLRMHAVIWLATSLSSRSPTWWPSESLMFLKRSRSTNSTASASPLRRALMIPCSRRSLNSRRLGSSVSGSRVATVPFPGGRSDCRVRPRSRPR